MIGGEARIPASGPQLVAVLEKYVPRNESARNSSDDGPPLFGCSSGLSTFVLHRSSRHKRKSCMRAGLCTPERVKAIRCALNGMKGGWNSQTEYRRVYANRKKTILLTKYGLRTGKERANRCIRFQPTSSRQ